MDEQLINLNLQPAAVVLQEGTVPGRGMTERRPVNVRTVHEHHAPAGLQKHKPPGPVLSAGGGGPENPPLRGGWRIFPFLL